MRLVDAASVKPSPPQTPGTSHGGMRGGPETDDPGRLTVENTDLFSLVVTAYGINRSQLSAPGWLRSERFDIAAKIPDGTTKEQFRLMLQNLLSERFKLAMHHEKKEMPVYELVVGTNGSRLKSAAAEDVVSAEQPSAPVSGQPELDADGYPVFPAGRIPTTSGANGKIRMRASEMTMDDLAGELSIVTGRHVTNATGIKGKYAVDLRWESPMATASINGVQQETDSGHTVFGAVQSQLGLKLEPKKGQVEMLVIDQMEEVPTGN